MIRLIFIVLVLSLTGCSYFQKHGAIKSGDVSVVGVPDAGKSATLNTSQAGSVLPLPEGTTFTMTKFEAIPATLGPNGHPAIPARTVTEITLTKPTELRTTESHVQADTGTIDTSVAQHKQDLAASAPLLYAAILAGVAAVFFLYRAYPTPAAICGGASIVFMVAWKVAGAPVWLWVVGAIALAGAAFLYIGHERGLSTPQPKP